MAVDRNRGLVPLLVPGVLYRGMTKEGVHPSVCYTEPIVPGGLIVSRLASFVPILLSLSLLAGCAQWLSLIHVWYYITAKCSVSSAVIDGSLVWRY